MLVTLALLVGLLGCAEDSADQPGSALGTGGPKQITVAQARVQEQRILNQRARAVRDRNLPLFMRRVDRSDKGLMARQRRYFANLVQLPLRRLSWEVTKQQWGGVVPRPRWGKVLHVPQVRLTTQLDGYDVVPVVRTVGFAFAFRKGRATIVADRTSDGAPLFAGTPAPWDLTAISVRAGPGVLGIFDAATIDSAPAVLGAVRNGIAEIDRSLPFSWSRRVVVYSVADRGVLASFTDVPGGTLENLGALTFPTRARTGRPRVASTRMLLMPSSVRASEQFLAQITRHELSHVAIGARDDGVPAWVSEGIAEYLGASSVPRGDWMIPTSARDRARVTSRTALPASRTFNGPDQEWNYALSWIACDYIAATQGEARLWELVDAMHDGGQGTSDTEQDAVLRELLGYDGDELGRRAAARIREIFTEGGD